MVNKDGERTHLWCAPVLIMRVEDIEFLMVTNCRLPTRKSMSHWRMKALTGKTHNFLCKIVGRMVLEVELRSRIRVLA